MSKIEWTDSTWNPVTGCTPCAAGCVNCYARTMHRRLMAMGIEKYERDFPKVVCHPEELDKPSRWRKPRKIFVCSMSDLFHEQVTGGFMFWVWWTMVHAPQHTFQVLTKRPNRMRTFFETLADQIEPDYNDRCGGRIALLEHGPEEIRNVHQCGRALLFADMLEMWGSPPDGCAYPTYDCMEGPIGWPTVLPNLWLGASVSTQADLDKAVPGLLATPAAVRFLSVEPLLGPVDLGAYLGTAFDGGGTNELYQYNAGINLVIVGAESGPHRRECREKWVRDIADQCRDAGVKVFVKQIHVDGKLVKMPADYPQEMPR